MQQYIVQGWDSKDDKALDRRMANRTAHFGNARTWKAKGNYILGAAMLGEGGKMIGSTMVLQFETPEELQQWINSEPYVTGKVWERYEVYPARLADIEKYFAELNK